jgi:hypothetical protein
MGRSVCHVSHTSKEHLPLAVRGSEWVLGIKALDSADLQPGEGMEAERLLGLMTPVVGK